MANSREQIGATAAYQKAITLARQHVFLNEEALIHERYGDFLQRSGEDLSAELQYESADGAYNKWGALRKCDDLKENIN